jgi:serine/threonine protein kinase
MYVCLPLHFRTSSTLYALKVMPKALVVSFSQQRGVVLERTVMDMVSHPFVCRLLGTARDDKTLYMLTEFVPGGELYSLLQRSEGISTEDARFYGACIVSVLEALHAATVIYRDLKPENVLIDSQGYAKVRGSCSCSWL